jgi:pyruvate kinase
LQFSSGVYPVFVAERPEDWKAYVSDWLKTNGAEGRFVGVTEGPSRTHPDANNRLEIIGVAHPGE